MACVGRYARWTRGVRCDYATRDRAPIDETGDICAGSCS